MAQHILHEKNVQIIVNDYILERNPRGMSIFIHENGTVFHLQNKTISYIMTVLPGGDLGQLYFGKRIHDRETYPTLLEGCIRSHSALIPEADTPLSLEHVKREYPVWGSGDFRQGALDVRQPDGSRVQHLAVQGYEVLPGKPGIPGLPAVYTEADDEAETLKIYLHDEKSSVDAELSYTIFSERNVIARSARIINGGEREVQIERAMSLCLDLPDADYEWMQFSGSWARERHPITRHLQMGTVSVESLRGHSSHQENPFVILKRPGTDECCGEAMGFSLLYSGNFRISSQVDAYNMTRLLMGIHPDGFSWQLKPGASFDTPEALITWSDQGLNGLSRTLHDLYRQRLARGEWRDRPRPILINNWEATYFDFNEEKLLAIAEKAKDCGVELFVLDDGWFGARRSDNAGLGDWIPCRDLLPNGIKGLSEKIEALGMKFGLWIEPEMVNPDSDLYREHPDWALQVPGYQPSLSRNQYVLDFSRQEVVDYVYEQIAAILRESKVSYIKWDMNRSITDCYSLALPADQQGEVYHRYILNVYAFYERLIREFPHILLESCAGGGGRFDAGMLYYAPQAWTSDNTDAVDRLKIQYGTSYGYPIVSMGSHVSAVPNHQVNRVTPLKTRAEVAFFGTYGYELDLNRLSPEEQEQVRSYSAFMKEYRELIQFGTFCRLQPPYTNESAAWMVVSDDRKEAIVGYYRILARPNAPFERLRLTGLDPDVCYEVKGIGTFYGDELMNAGLVVSEETSGKSGGHILPSHDFASELFILREKQD